MGIEVSDSGVSLYRLIKGGDTGLNLRLSDLYGQVIEAPNLLDIIKSVFTRKPIRLLLKPYPVTLIRKLEQVQLKVDRKIEQEIEKAKRGSR